MRNLATRTMIGLAILFGVFLVAIWGYAQAPKKTTDEIVNEAIKESRLQSLEKQKKPQPVYNYQPTTVCMPIFNTLWCR